MAIELTTIAVPPQIFGYSTVPGGFIDRTNAPRGSVVFEDSSSEIPIPGLGDQQQLSVSMTLPANFAYVLVELNLSLQSATDMGDWDDTANGSFRTAGAMVALWIALHSPGVARVGSAAATTRSYDFQHLPRALTRADGSASMSVNVGNGSIDGEAAFLRFYARFLQYDVSQHHDVAVNLPTLTR